MQVGKNALWMDNYKLCRMDKFAKSRIHHVLGFKIQVLDVKLN